MFKHHKIVENLAFPGNVVRELNAVRQSSWALIVLLFGSLSLCGCLTPPVVSTNTIHDTHSEFVTAHQQQREESEAKKLADAPRERVFWAGVATSGEFASAKERFRIVYPLMDEFAKTLNAELQPVHPEAFDLANTGGEPVSFESNDALVMALVLDRERCRVEPVEINGQRKYLVEIGIQGQLVIVDLKEKVITYSFPISCKAIDRIAGEPTETDFARMARMALCGASRVDGKPVNLKDQFLDRLANKKATPRSPVMPLAVRSVHFADGCAAPQFVGVTSAKVLPVDDLRKWEDEIGSEFAAYLASAINLGVNPYARDATNSVGGAMIAQMSFLDNRLLNARLRPPSRVFDLEISSLTCELDPDKSGQYINVLNYGFKGSLTALEPEGATIKMSQELDLSLSGLKKKTSVKGEKITGVPSREDYQKLVMRRVLPDQLNSDSVDHFYSFRKSLENVLLQLKDEIFFEIKDPGKRYGPLREDFAGASLLN